MKVKMESIPAPVVVFDLDGTLADSAPAITVAVNWLISRYGAVPFSVAQVRSFMGRGIEMVVKDPLIQSGIAKQLSFDDAFPTFMAHHIDNGPSSIHPWKDVDQALTTLQKSGVRLALCTNKLAILTYPLLQTLGWQNMFDRVICGDTFTVRKPNRLPLIAAVGERTRRAVFVGDTTIDLETANAAKIPCIIMDPANLLIMPRRAKVRILNSFRDLPSHVLKLLLTDIGK